MRVIRAKVTYLSRAKLSYNKIVTVSTDDQNPGDCCFLGLLRLLDRCPPSVWPFGYEIALDVKHHTHTWTLQNSQVNWEKQVYISQRILQDK